MYKNHKVAVVVPAYNEETLITPTLEGIPGFVDMIFVVDDASTDKTRAVIEARQGQDPRVHLVPHEVNQGLGKSLIDGYGESKSSDADVTVVMAGDNQMDPRDLPALLDKIIDGGFDYVKGNRLLHGNIESMPRYRFLGNSVLTILTKFATGYYSLMDPQCGYTAIRNGALKKIPIEKMTRRYAYNADILCMLNIGRFRVTDVEVRPVYGQSESKIKLSRYIPTASALLIRLFFRRLWRRYVILDFHPLVLFYLFAFCNFFLLIIPFAIRFVWLYFTDIKTPHWTFVMLVFTILITFQSILFAIWMDMDYNRQPPHA